MGLNLLLTEYILELEMLKIGGSVGKDAKLSTKKGGIPQFCTTYPHSLASHIPHVWDICKECVIFYSHIWGVLRSAFLRDCSGMWERG